MIPAKPEIQSCQLQARDPSRIAFRSDMLPVFPKEQHQMNAYHSPELYCTTTEP